MPGITDQQKEAVREVFTQVDGDNDGQITHDEIKKLFDNLGHRPSDDGIKKIIENSDKDNTGTVSLDELTASFSSIREMDRLLILWAAMFRSLDKDHSGKLDRDEIKALLTSEEGSGPRTKKDLDETIDKMDVTKDGQISFAEFKLAMLDAL